jgi:Domain of unknown function (DUF4263)
MVPVTSNDIEVAFLGIAERSAIIREGETLLTKWNVLGLKNYVPLYYFPTHISGWNFAFAVRHHPQENIALDIIIKTEEGDSVGNFQLRASFSDIHPEDSPLPIASSREGSFIVPLPEAWHFLSLRIPELPVLLLGPRRMLLTLRRTDATEEIIGEFETVLVDPPPLTAERIAAIKSDPSATKTLRMRLKCNHCHGKISAYSGLEQDQQQEADGYLWYANLPENFVCQCGRTVIDLRSLKRNMFAPLGNVTRRDPFIASTPLYEVSTLHNILTEFSKLLDSAPRDEAVLQKFLEDNTILFRQFPATEIFFKPSVLNFFETDFVILISQRELILVEIEKTITPLLIQSGDQAARLTHAIDQVGNWLHTFDEHRLACLDGMKIAREKVATIREVIIAGRDRGYNPDHLRRLKGRCQNSRISLLTFDDLASSLSTLIQQMGRL